MKVTLENFMELSQYIYVFRFKELVNILTKHKSLGTFKTTIYWWWFSAKNYIDFDDNFEQILIMSAQKHGYHWKVQKKLS